MEDFNPSGIVPVYLKKIAGAVWADVFDDPRNVQYLQWTVANNPNQTAKAMATSALEWWNSGEPVKQE
jgi:hypothetical protein